MTKDIKGFVNHVDDIQLEGGNDPVQGVIKWKTLISSDKTPSSEISVGIGYLPAGASLKLHKHSSTEFYHILIGKGEMTINDEIFSIRKGSTVYIPSNVLHRIKAIEEELSFLYGFAEDSYEDVEYMF